MAQLFSEECGAEAPGRWPGREALAAVDAGFQELTAALKQCRARDAGAQGLQDCLRELPDRGESGQVLIDMALELQQVFGCAGLCRALEVPLFAFGGLSAAHRPLPSCHSPLAESATAAGRAVALWLGFVAAPSFLVAAAWAMRVLDAVSSTFPPAGGYLPVPCSAMAEMANVKI